MQTSAAFLCTNNKTAETQIMVLGILSLDIAPALRIICGNKQAKNGVITFILEWMCSVD